MKDRDAKAPRVVFDGYYGMRNTGDDAFCVVADQVARQRWGTDDIAFVGVASQLPPVAGPVRGLQPERPRVRGHGRFAAVPAMLQARTVVHVGGSTFMQPLTRHRDQARLGRLGLLDLHAVGVSVGPFADGDQATRVRRTLAAFSSLSVRDSASLERVADLGLEVPVALGFDVAVLLDPPGADQDGPPGGGSRPLLGVTVCAHEAKRGQDARVERQRFERTADLVERVASETGSAVRILVFNDHPHWGDQDLSAELADRLTGPVDLVARHPDPRIMLAEVARCDAFLATRLHSAVFAYAAGVPFAVVAYQAKGRELAHDMGVPEDLVFSGDGPDPAPTSDRIVELLGQRGPVATRPVEEARQLARDSFPARL